MKRILLCLFLLSLPVFGQVQRNRTLAWDYTGDISQVVEWRLYYGSQQGGPYSLGKVIIPVGTKTATVTLPKGTYYFVVTAANPDNESGYSNEATTTIFDTALKPINLVITVGP